MMKLKRLVASMLALLLMVSLLPIGAVATDNPEGETIPTTTEDIGTNSGTIVNNNHTVTNNVAVENTPTENEFDPPYKEGTGHIENNNAGATVVNNQAGATVVNNQAGSTVEMNNAGGIIEKNSGYVGDWQDDVVEQFQTNSGNKGTVQDNLTNGKVNNLKGGAVTNNGGTVYNDGGGTVVDNNAGGTVYNNGGTVVDNNAGGKVDNNEGGEVGTNNAGGTVTNKGGTVGINNGTVYNNSQKSVVKVNEVGGVVANASSGPEATTGPKVETNFGTVEYDGDPVPKYYGVHYVVDGKKVYLGQFEESNTVTISDLDISRSGYKLVKCEKVEGYINNDFEDFTDQTVSVDSVKTTVATKNEDGSVSSFIILAPTRLTLLWEKIVSVFKPAPSNEPEAKPVKAAALPSTVKAEDVKVGTVVRAKGQLFRVIEMDDGSMTVVTMGKLSKKDMADLKAFLSKYFTPEQIELLLGDPELISGELAEKLFGGNTGHIVFKAEKNLFA